MLYPQRHEAFGAFLAATAEAVNIIHDQQMSNSSQSRDEACIALQWRARDVQTVLRNKLTVVAPVVSDVAVQVVYDLYNLADLGNDPLISWRHNNASVDQLFRNLAELNASLLRR